MMSKEGQVMIEYISKEVTVLLMRTFGWDMRKAMDVLMNSETYAKLEDEETALFYQSPAYVFEILNEEITNGTSK